jgi:hypothetical protein
LQWSACAPRQVFTGAAHNDAELQENRTRGAPPLSAGNAEPELVVAGLRRPEDAAADRESLRRLLKEKGILRAGPGQPIRGRDGTRAPWMFYSWNCSLTSKGSALAGRCLLDRLQSFAGRQLACYGYTGVPLLAA